MTGVHSAIVAPSCSNGICPYFAHEFTNTGNISPCLSGGCTLHGLTQFFGSPIICGGPKGWMHPLALVEQYCLGEGSFNIW